MIGGVFSLGDFAVTSAAAYMGAPVTDLDGMTAATVQLRLAYGAGGTAIRAYVQTSLDQGTTWIDIWSVLFGTASETAIMGFAKSPPPDAQVTPTDGALSDDTVVPGILGDRLRVRLTTTGNFSNSTVLSARVAVS
jgi:hypothetical protein